ncbi:predicted protein [Methanosarcina acetivorans C2A]|uniref:Uncharacterized protein n=1 Tax=Methanosarcina acetivorans (strain ATCC 35395 / DSM 2834 / JCM 12185 / C2A) TaxID=188937 RepID=Q8TJX9_METAC|nr:predicted protein [Methanosarcina acetivorans C2A]
MSSNSYFGKYQLKISEIFQGLIELCHNPYFQKENWSRQNYGNKNVKFPAIIKYFIIVFAFLTTCSVYSFIEPYLIEEQTTIISDSDVPQNFVGKKIIFISDIHHG